MSTDHSSPRFALHRFFARGESLVAATGMAFVAILAFAVAGVVWISARTIDDSVSLQTEANIRETGALIASQAELRLGDQDLAGLRRLMLDAVASGLVSECRLTDPKHGVIVTSDASQNIITKLPDQWNGLPTSSSRIEHDDDHDRTLFYEFIAVDEQSGLELEIVVNQSSQIAGSDSIRASSVGVMSVGLILMLLVYRRFRTRLGALASIGEALREVATGERRTACLVVDEQLGVEATAWNALLTEKERSEQADIQNELIIASKDNGGESVGLAAACNTLTQGVILVESDLAVVYANGASCVFLRVDRDELLKSTFDTVSDADPVIDIVRRVVSQQGPTRQVIEIGEVDSIDDQGAILRLVVTRVDSDGIPRAMIFIDDVTQQRLADKSQNAFIAQATHELRTPLTTIRLYTEEAIEVGEDDEQLREKALNVIQSETRRLERIVGDMLCVAEIEAGSLSIRTDTMRTEQLFRDLEEDYRAQSKEKSIELVFDLPPKFPVIQADRDRLGQAMHNLIGNAIKYTPSGGRVEIKVEFTENDAMRIDVIDNGLGIDESQHERIFDRFCRADDRRISQVVGTGLGLALSREIARLHGGDVTVESAIDQGSTFTLIIPGVEELAKAA